jgi:hypothetical protein
MRRLALALALSWVTACGSNSASPTQPSPSSAPASGAPSAAASAYLNSVIDIAQRNSINRLTIDWTDYRNQVVAAAGSAQTIPDLFPAIRTAIALLRDGHSSSTCGLSSANSTFTLSDGGMFNVTTSVMADRNKTRFGDSIPPDEVISDQVPMIQRAIEWLQTGR